MSAVCLAFLLSYACGAWNTRLDFTLIFIPTVPAYLNVTPVNPKVVENSTIILSCNCGGCTFRPFWFKNSLPIHYNESRTPYRLLSNGSLLIIAFRHTAGNYSCGIHTSYWGWISMTVKLDVWCKCFCTTNFLLTEGKVFSEKYQPRPQGEGCTERKRPHISR